MSARRPVLSVSLDDELSRTACSTYKSLFAGQLDITTGPEPATVRLVRLDQLPTRRTNEEVVAIGEADLPSVVALMGSHPWLNHVISSGLFPSIEPELSSMVLWRLLGGRTDPATSTLFHKSFVGRKATVRDSTLRGKRLDLLMEYALQAGVSEIQGERIRDIAEELVSNALYDAPAEGKSAPVSRDTHVVLPKDQACTITYGMLRDMFFVRVQDRFGTLRRARLIQVLTRCAKQTEVTMDPSRGGAGLGLWRVFSGASLVVVDVKHNESTTFLVGIETKKSRRARKGRAIHLLFRDETGARS